MAVPSLPRPMLRGTLGKTYGSKAQTGVRISLLVAPFGALSHPMPVTDRSKFQSREGRRSPARRGPRPPECR